MPSFATFFRALVMLAAAVVALKAWQLHGLSAAQMKSLAARALELAQDTLQGRPRPALKALGRDDSTSAGVATYAATNAADAVVAPPIVTPAEMPAAPAVFPQVSPPTVPQSATPGELPDLPPADAHRLPALISRLRELGGFEPQLVAWGTSGRLFRFYCRATLDNVPNFTRHFESVATEPLTAVEDVLAKVEAWQSAERDRSRLR